MQVLRRIDIPTAQSCGDVVGMVAGRKLREAAEWSMNMIIDAHTHLWGDQYEEDKKFLLNAMDRFGIDRIYVSALTELIPDKDQVTEANREVAQFIRDNSGRVYGYVYISPEHDNAVDVLQRGIEEQGMDGVKLWMSTRCDDMRVNRVVERSIEYNVPILIHAFYKANGLLPNESVGEDVASLARRYPEAKIIMAHLGGNCYHGLPAIRDCPNVWADYSGSLFRGDELNYAVSCLGAERIVYGSDMPNSYLINYGQVLEATLSEVQREQILKNNALRLFDRSFCPERRRKAI